MILFLRSWWSTTYNRPLKDPLLDSYTVEELLYEFYDRMERTAAAEERLAKDTDKIEEAKDKAVLDWAEQEEKKELEEMKNMVAKAATDPSKDPENIKWMKKIIEQAKEEHGDNFGEDIEETFDKD